MGSSKRSVPQKKARRMPVNQETPTGTGAIVATRAMKVVNVAKDGTRTVVETITQGIPAAADKVPTVGTAVATEGMMTLVVPIKAQAIVGVTIALTGAMIGALITVVMIILAGTTTTTGTMMPTTSVKSTVVLMEGVVLGRALPMIYAAGCSIATLRVIAAVRRGAAHVLPLMTVVADPTRGRGISTMLEACISRTKKTGEEASFAVLLQAPRSRMTLKR